MMKSHFFENNSPYEVKRAYLFFLNFHPNHNNIKLHQFTQTIIAFDF